MLSSEKSSKETHISDLINVKGGWSISSYKYPLVDSNPCEILQGLTMMDGPFLVLEMVEGPDNWAKVWSLPYNKSYWISLDGPSIEVLSGE